jgi:hypothetical protein
MVMSRTLPLSESKAKLSEVVDGIVTTQDLEGRALTGLSCRPVQCL